MSHRVIPFELLARNFTQYIEALRNFRMDCANSLAAYAVPQLQAVTAECNKPEYPLGYRYMRIRSQVSDVFNQHFKLMAFGHKDKSFKYVLDAAVLEYLTGETTVWNTERIGRVFSFATLSVPFGGVAYEKDPTDLFSKSMYSYMKQHPDVFPNAAATYMDLRLAGDYVIQLASGDEKSITDQMSEIVQAFDILQRNIQNFISTILKQPNFMEILTGDWFTKLLQDTLHEIEQL